MDIVTAIKLIQLAPQIFALVKEGANIIETIEKQFPNVVKLVKDLWHIFVPEAQHSLETFAAALFDRKRLTPEQKDWFVNRGLLPVDPETGDFSQNVTG